MTRPPRLTRRFAAQMTEAGYRRLRAFAREAELEEGEVLSFLFENLDRITDDDAMARRLRLYRAALAGRGADRPAD